MDRIPPLRFRIGVHAIAVLSSLSAMNGQAAAPQRGVTPTSPSASLSPNGPYYALVIGNDNYQHLNKLKSAVNDADAVAQLLQEEYGFTVTVLRDVSRTTIVTELNRYRRTLTPNSNLLVYFAGHGWHDPETGEVYWLPVTAERDNNTNWVTGASDIIANVRAIPSRHILIISDSCYGGALIRDAGVGINPIKRSALLAKKLNLKSRHWMTSGSDEPVLDGSGSAGHSIFATALLEGLKQEDDEFDAKDLFDRFIEPVVAGRSAQTPRYDFIRDSGHNNGDFVFFRRKKTFGDPSLDSLFPEDSNLFFRHKKTFGDLSSDSLFTKDSNPLLEGSLLLWHPKNTLSDLMKAAPPRGRDFFWLLAEQGEILRRSRTMFVDTKALAHSLILLDEKYLKNTLLLAKEFGPLSRPSLVEDPKVADIVFEIRPTGSNLFLLDDDLEFNLKVDGRSFAYESVKVQKGLTPQQEAGNLAKAMLKYLGGIRATPALEKK